MDDTSEEAPRIRHWVNGVEQETVTWDRMLRIAREEPRSGIKHRFDAKKYLDWKSKRKLRDIMDRSK